MDANILLKIFVKVDDFFKFHAEKVKYLYSDKYKRDRPQSKLNGSEILTILISFHHSGYRTFKHFYKDCICKYHKQDFPDLVSYNRFVELQKYYIEELFLFSKTFALGDCTGISFVDSTKIEVVHIKREKSMKLFKGIAKKSGSTTGFYVGFKLHLLINHVGEIIDHQLTGSRTSDIKVLEFLSKNLYGKVFGDKGCISAETVSKLKQKGIELITKVRKNMKKKFITAFDKVLLRKRAVIESAIDKLKNQCYLEHSRHRSHINFLMNIFAAISAYHFDLKKVNINMQLNNAITVVKNFQENIVL